MLGTFVPSVSFTGGFEMKAVIKKRKRENVANWIHIDDSDLYGEYGATVCDKCHYAMNEGYFFEPDTFKYCPNCGRKMCNKTGYHQDLVDVFPRVFDLDEPRKP